MGFGHPRLCVQVKSGRNAVDLADYNRLQGNIGAYGAEHGLLVSLGDFTRSVRNENERSFFQIRLWGPREIADRLVETYDALPADIQSELPIRRRGILIETEE
jgi:restriction system protein